MAETITLAGADGFEFSAYHEPAFTPRKGGVIVIQEIFGIDRHVRADIERWAKMGYEAIAPAMFDRLQRDFHAEHDDAGIQAGIAKARATPLDQALGDIAACRDFLAQRGGKVCIVGYCYGGSLTWLSAGRVEGLAAASSYYGSMVQANAALKPMCPTIVHLGRTDAGIPADDVAAAIAAAHGDSVPVYIYEGAGHGFNNESPERYSAEAADLARHRTLELFDAALMGETIRLASARDGFEYDAWRVKPTDARRGGLVVCHAIWGVTPHLRDLADGYAEDGYEVIVPSLFDRLQRGFPERDTDAALQARQMGFGEQTRWGADVLDAVQAAIDALVPPVFALGFCFGGTVAWLAASRCTGLSAVASFYGGQVIDYRDETPKVPTILHLGKTDPLISPADVETLREIHPDLPIYVYPAGHAFVAPNGFHADSARLSRLRTLALFSRSGGGRGEV